MRFQLAKARREAFGQSSEAGARIGQFELALEDVEVTLAAIEAADETATPTPVDAFTRRKPARRPLPDHRRAFDRFTRARRHARAAAVAYTGSART